MIPILNTLDNQNNKISKLKKIDFSKLNNLNFKNLELNRYPIVKILNKLPDKSSFNMRQ